MTTLTEYTSNRVWIEEMMRYFTLCLSLLVQHSAEASRNAMPVKVYDA